MALYTLGIWLYGLAMRAAARFHPKAKQWVVGRRQWQQKQARLQAKRQAGQPLVWVHCASLGEFEQGRPIMEGLKAARPDLEILLTFFSPSGYELRKDYPGADYVAYLPLDSPAQARAFVQLWRPDLAVFVKYEFWYHHLRALQRQHIPVILASGLFRPGQLFFRAYGGPFLKVLRGFAHFFVQNEASAQLLQRHGIMQHTVAGDTRVDRVRQIAEQAPRFPLVENFCQQAQVLIAGSTWPEDEARLLTFINEQLPADWRVIIAPHEVKTARIQAIAEQLAVPSVRYSSLQQGRAVGPARVLLIDNIGMLSALYQYGRIAYIGGGFKTGLHNTLEPIAFGLPVLFGPHYERFEEARYLAEQGGGLVVRTAEELAQHFRQLQDAAAYQAASASALAYVQRNQGGSGTVVGYVLLALK